MTQGVGGKVGSLENRGGKRLTSDTAECDGWFCDGIYC